MRFAFFDQQGRVESAHNDDTVSELPEGAVELSVDQWEDRFNLRFVSGNISYDPIIRPVADIKAEKWDAIKVERDRRKSGGFKVKVGSSNKWFHSDADSRIQHLGLKDKARDLIAGGGAMTDKLTILGQTVKWKTMDGSFVDVSAQVAFDIVAAAGDLDAQLFAAAETHKAAMEASADPASYDFSAGWPKSFGE